MKLIQNLLAASLVTVLVACGGAEDRKAAYMEKADQSLTAGDLDKARIELKNVLQIDPKDAQAWYKLGTVFERKKDYRKSFAHYSKAVELDPENNEYQAKLGRFYLILAGDIEKATEKMNLILSKDKADINGLMLKAGILLKQDNAADAKEITRNIFEDHPDNVENAVFLATLYSRDKDLDDAVAVLETALKSNPGNQSLLTVLGNTLFINKDFVKSEKVWQEILDTHPDVFQNHLQLALFYQKTGESAKAEQVLRTAIAADEKDVSRKLALIEFIQQVQGIDQATTELEKIIQDDRGDGTLRLALAQLQIANNDLDSAVATYETAVEDFSDEETGITSRVQLAKIYMQKENVKAATAIIDEAAGIAPNDSEVNLVKAKIAIFNKDIEQAIVSLRTVIKDDPANIEAYLLLAAAHKANNELSQAEDTIARAYENNRDNIKALLPLAKYHVKNKNVAEAEKAIDDYLRLDADNYEALSIKSSILNAKKDFSAAAVLADRMMSLYPDKENGYLQAVPQLLSKQRIDEAIALMNSGHEKTGSLQILRLNATVLVSAGKYQDAVSMLEAVAKEDSSEQIQLLLAKAHVANKDSESAVKVLRDSIMQDKTRTESYILLSNVYSTANDSEQAFTALEDGVRANPDNIRLAMTLAGLYEKAGNFENAIEQYEKVLATSPDNLLANNNLAALLSDYRSDDASLKRAIEIADKLKNVNQPVILDTVGWVYYKAGNYADAVAVLKKVVAAQPAMEIFNYHLGMAYQKTGNNEEARKYLEAALASGKEFQGRDAAVTTLNSL